MPYLPAEPIAGLLHSLIIFLLHPSFDTLIDSYIENNIGADPGFLPPELAAGLTLHVQDLIRRNVLLPAGIGNGETLRDLSVRTDAIYWLDRAHKNVHENEFLDMMDLFVGYLNEQCYTGITGYEFHFALYKKGDFYTKHLDQFKSDPSRQFSMITYLNANWVPDDGGELKIYHKGGLQLISPTSGKTIFFKSNELVHEVLVTQATRLSITGWLKN